MVLLDVISVTKDFGGLRANDDISFSLDKGELLGLIGPNGAGKTTLFNCISGVYPVTSGEIIFDSEDITELKAHDVARRVGVGDLAVLDPQAQCPRLGDEHRPVADPSGLGLDRVEQPLQLAVHFTCLPDVPSGPGRGPGSSGCRRWTARSGPTCRSSPARPA